MSKGQDDTSIKLFVKVAKADCGLDFVTEYRFHPTRKWRADFACIEKKIIIEVEGGAPSCSFVVSLPTTATLYNNQATLYITEFTSNLVNGVGKLDLNGIFNMSLGGKLSVPVNYVCGNYSGTFNVVINYN